MDKKKIVLDHQMDIFGDSVPIVMRVQVGGEQEIERINTS
jgi:hypothetical protein